MKRKPNRDVAAPLEAAASNPARKARAKGGRKKRAKKRPEDIRARG